MTDPDVIYYTNACSKMVTSQDVPSVRAMLQEVRNKRWAKHEATQALKGLESDMVTLLRSLICKNLPTPSALSLDRPTQEGDIMDVIISSRLRDNPYDYPIMVIYAGGGTASTTLNEEGVEKFLTLNNIVKTNEWRQPMPDV